VAGTGTIRTRVASSRTATAMPTPRVFAVTHHAALLEHLTDEETYLLPLIEEHLTVAEYGRLYERFAAETPNDRLLLFLRGPLSQSRAG
jgi:hypothetical protein